MKATPTARNFKGPNMNHKLIVVFDSFDDETEARWYATYLRHTDDHVAEIYVVQDESMEPK